MCQYCVHIDEFSAVALVWISCRIERYIFISAAIKILWFDRK